MTYYYKEKEMKQRLTNDYLLDIATQEFTTMHYKVLMILLTGKSYTQVQIAKTLGIKHRQNLTPTIKELTEKGYIEVDYIQGRNKYLKAIIRRKEEKQEGEQLMFNMEE